MWNVKKNDSFHDLESNSLFLKITVPQTKSNTILKLYTGSYKFDLFCYFEYTPNQYTIPYLKPMHSIGKVYVNASILYKN